MSSIGKAIDGATTGTGTADMLTKWTGVSTLGDSHVKEDVPSSAVQVDQFAMDVMNAATQAKARMQSGALSGFWLSSDAVLTAFSANNLYAAGSFDVGLTRTEANVWGLTQGDANTIAAIGVNAVPTAFKNADDVDGRDAYFRAEDGGDKVVANAKGGNFIFVVGEKGTGNPNQEAADGGRVIFRNSDGSAQMKVGPMSTSVARAGFDLAAGSFLDFATGGTIRFAASATTFQLEQNISLLFHQSSTGIFYKGPRTLDAAPLSQTIKGSDAWPAAAVNTSGGNLVLYGGKKTAASGGSDGWVVFQQPSGTPGTHEMRVQHDGTDTLLDSITGDFSFKLAGAEKARISASGLGIGTTPTELFQVVGTTFNTPLAQFTDYHTGTPGMSVDIRKAHGTEAAPLEVGTGDEIGPFAFSAYGNSAFQDVVDFLASVENLSGAGATLAWDGAFRLKARGLSAGAPTAAATLVEGRYTSAAAMQLGFFAATPVAKPSATGSRGGNAALASLLTALANLGLITDSTTP